MFVNSYLLRYLCLLRVLYFNVQNFRDLVFFFQLHNLLPNFKPIMIFPSTTLNIFFIFCTLPEGFL